MEKKKLPGLLLLGAGALLLTRYKRLPTEETHTITIDLNPLFIPATFSESKVNELASQIKPKLSPTFFPLGWKLSFTPITIPTPVGNVSYSLPSRQLPPMAPWRAYQIEKKWVPTVEKVPFGYQIKFKTVTI